jgi:hypothetical protein
LVKYRVDAEGELDQGDIIRRVTVTHKLPADSAEPPQILVSNVVVLSHGCDIDKPKSDTVLVARAIRISALPAGGLGGEIRKNRVHHALYLPAEGPVREDVYIDWRSIQPVDKLGLLNARATERYIGTVTGDLLDALADGLWGFFFRDRDS